MFQHLARIQVNELVELDVRMQNTKFDGSFDLGYNIFVK